MSRRKKRQVTPSRWKATIGVNLKNHQATFVRMMAAFGICRKPRGKRFAVDGLVLDVPEWLFYLAVDENFSIDQIRKARKDRTLRAALIAASKLARMPDAPK